MKDNSQAQAPHYSPEAEAGSKDTTRDAARFAFKYLRFIVWFTVLVSALTTTLVYLIPPVYISTGVVLVERGKSPTLRSDPLRTAAELDTVLNSEIEIVKSLGLAEAVVERLGLMDREPKDTAMRRLMAAILDRMGNLGLITRVERREKLVAGILKTMEIKQPAMSDILRISYSSEDPQHAQAVAQAIIDVYVERHQSIFSDNTAEFFEARASEIKTAIDAARASLQRATDENQLASLRLQLTGLESTYLLYTGKVDRARAASLGDESLANIRVIDHPRLPPKPRFARLLLILAGTLAGFAIAIAAAFVRHHFDHRVHSPEQLADLDLPLLMSVRSSRIARIRGWFGGKGPGLKSHH